MRRQTAVTADLEAKLLFLFGFARQRGKHVVEVNRIILLRSMCEAD